MAAAMPNFCWRRPCLERAPDIHAAIACDTDGIDGSEDNAGALINPTTLTRAMDAGMDARVRLMDNDAHGFFAALDDLIVTGPTRTKYERLSAQIYLSP